VLALLVGAWCLFVNAQTGRPATSPLALVGNWTGTALFRSGTLMTMRMTLTQNGAFRGVATVDGKPVWTFSGRWELETDGSKDVLVWRYEQSAPELPAASKIDRDDIVGVDGDKMVLRSRVSAKEHMFTRVN
jgi:hypothetical protein